MNSSISEPSDSSASSSSFLISILLIFSVAKAIFSRFFSSSITLQHKKYNMIKADNNYLIVNLSIEYEECYKTKDKHFNNR